MNEFRVAVFVVMVFLAASSYFVLTNFNSTDEIIIGKVLGETEEFRYKILRKRMVDDLSTKGINNSQVLDAMLTVPRQDFLPKNIADRSYNNIPLPIGFNRTSPPPYQIALILETVSDYDVGRVLEVGTGCGYQTALLSHLAREVISIEENSILIESAREEVNKLGLDNVVLIHGDPLRGWMEKAPYDTIIVNSAVREVPRHISEQLSHNGIMVLALQDNGFQVLTLYHRVNGSIKTQVIGKVAYDHL
ncbi:MAG: protein-L-isoaspartate(D-aspartate) O-methyltransferase [Methanobacteriota archaeon]